MRLATYDRGGRQLLGAVVKEWVLDLQAASDGALPHTMLGLIAAGDAALARARELGAELHTLLERSPDDAGPFASPLAEVRLLAPIPRPPRNVMCVGWNYLEHFEEGQGRRGAEREELPEYPTFFTKLATSVIGPGEGVRLDPRISRKLDWEVELAVVLRRGGLDIPAAHAMQHVFGYTVANDISVRDVQRRHGGQWFRGKTMDTHCPLGPWIVTADEVPDPHALRLACRVNGAVKQDASTAQMVFRVPRIIAELSLGTTLEAGDVILTGTPPGVGFARTPPEYLRAGDEMELEIEGVGTLRNPVVEV